MREHSDSDCGIAACGNVVVIDLRGTLGGQHVRTLGEIYGQLIEQHRRLVALCVARRGVPTASRDARKEGIQVARQFASHIAQVAIVFEDSGLVGELMRTLVRSFSAMSRQTPITVYDDLESAVRGIDALVEGEPSTNKQALLGVLRSLRDDVAG